MSYDINSQQVDIENLFKQNVNDLASIKELYRRLDKTEEKIRQISYNNNVLYDKLKKEIETLKKLIQLGGNQTGDNQPTTDLSEINTRIDNLNNNINEINTRIDNLNNNINEINSRLTTINEKVDDMQSSGNLSLRDLVTGEIFIKGTSTTPTVSYGNIVLSTNNLTVNENANTTFTVKLDKAPTNNQVVNIEVNNSYCTVNPSSLTFTHSNYSTTQTVTVNGIHDRSNYTNKTSVITLSSTSVTNKTINVTINNIDEQPSETIPVQSIALNKSESTLTVGDTEQLTVTFNPENATNKNINWSSNDDEKATVVNGLVTAVTSGNAIITATSEDGNRSASCNYTIQEQAVTPPVVTHPVSLKLFLNGEGGAERYDSSNCLIWLDQSGNGNNYTLVPSSTSLTNEQIKNYIWPKETNISLSSGITNLDNTAAANNNDGLTSMNFTWDIKLKYNNTSQQVILGNGTKSNNAANAFAITTNNGNIIIRGNYDKLAIVNKLTATMTTGNFYRITVTNDGSTCKLYLDGEFIASCNSTAFTSIASGVLYTNKTDYAYIKYYDKALTESEIQGGIINE